jgi:hypothetical protein
MTELGLEKFLTVIGFEKGAVTSKRGGQPQTGVIAEKIGATKVTNSTIHKLHDLRRTYGRTGSISE